MAEKETNKTEKERKNELLLLSYVETIEKTTNQKYFFTTLRLLIFYNRHFTLLPLADKYNLTIFMTHLKMPKEAVNLKVFNL